MTFFQQLMIHTVQYGGPRRLITGLLHQDRSVPVVCLSTSCFWNTRKNNPYGCVDQEKYSSLVRSVVSSKVSSQTPTSLAEEDRKLYGPVIRSKPVAEDCVPRAPKNAAPLLNPSKVLDQTQEAALKAPLRFALQRGQGRSYIPSVTRILQQTMPLEQAFYLERWRKKMIAELGEEGFSQYTASKSVVSLSCIHPIHLISIPAKMTTVKPAHSSDLEGLAEQEEGGVDVCGYIQSVQHVLADVGGVRAIESAVKHQSLSYTGLVDCVAEYRGKLCIIDWKTSEKPKPLLRNTFDNPLQVAAYIGAMNSDDNYGFLVENGLIVVAYKDGSPAHPHFMDPDLCLEYWNKWLFRLEEYMDRKERKDNTG
ncbi:mitochondrial genome maintenance exonuclease 1 [Polyodon spathula]|uniref:mitochondrial genome maintenance exonuclease 1 n=1 Tax=Polyodon spathula TaxID=7913 RepID=UPI001B7F10D5|nr:mitochondrial genome maintenance exonuclease 1 [Polyodon spathula]